MMKKPPFQSRVAAIAGAIPQTRVIMLIAAMSGALIASCLPMLHDFGFDPAHRELEMVAGAWAVVLAFGVAVDLYNLRRRAR